MKIFSSKKRVAIIGAVTAVTLVGGGTAFAYWTTTGTRYWLRLPSGQPRPDVT